jgi:hypothetical protein
VIGFAQPAWLFGLLLAPLIWYLHRSGPVLRRVPVPSLELWRDAAASAAQAGPQRRPDPAWRRRAAIAVLLSLALAGPQWTTSAPRVTVWLDDSLSMHVADAEGTRLQQGIALAQQALRATSARDVIVRHLSDPSQARDRFDPEPALASRDPAEAREPRLPPPQALDPSRAHWLVTDGADAAVNAWAADAPIGRLLPVGRPAANAGITRISARAQLNDPAALAVQVRVLNGGGERTARTLDLLAGGRRLASRAIDLEAGTAATFDFVTTAAGAPITAQLAPSDALASDDALTLDPSALAPLAAQVDARCPEPVRRAVHAHPALRISDGAVVPLAIDCGGVSAAMGTPRVVLASGATSALDATRLLWSASASSLPRRLAGRMPARARGSLAAPGDRDVVLLSSDSTPLLILREGPPRVVESALDLEAPGFAAGPGLPLLVAALADLALDTALLGRTVSVDRGDDASRVMALDASPLPARAAPRDDAAPLNLRPLLWLALTLLAWDLWALARRIIRDRAVPAEARA